MRTDFGIPIPRMDYGLCSFMGHIPYSVLWVFLFFILNFTIQAQPGMSCIGKVNVTVNANGTALVTPEMFLRTADPTHVVLDIPGSDDNFVDCSQIGYPLDVMLRDTMSGALCWSELNVEDKSSFSIVFCRPDTMVSCLTDLGSLPISDFIEIEDDCLTLDDILASSPYPPYADSIIAEPFEHNPDTLKLIKRTWFLIDLLGHSEMCMTWIAVKRLDLDLLKAPDDIEIFCPEDPFDLGITGDIPFDWDELLYSCKISVDTNTWVSPLLCDRDKKYKRQWIFMDWARDTMILDTQEIIRRDTIPIQLIKPEELDIVQVDSTCGFVLVVEAPSQEASCCESELSQLNIFVDGNPVSVGDEVVLDFGKHTIEYGGYDDCLRPVIGCIDSFEVNDIFGPMLICNSDPLAIPINEGCEIWVHASAMFAGLINDNCNENVILKARKTTVNCSDADTVFSELITFCMEEVLLPVFVEVVAVDTTNQLYSDTCVVPVIIQDKVKPDIWCVPDTVMIYLSDVDTTATIDSFTLIAHLFDKLGIAEVRMTGSGTAITGSGTAFTGSGLPFFVDGNFMEFDCDDLDTYHVDIVATDTQGNMDSCTAILSVLDTSNLCPPLKLDELDTDIKGLVQVNGHMPLAGAEITVASSQGSLFQMTDEFGEFSFGMANNHEQQTLRVDYPDLWIRGLSAYDLYLLQRIIIGVTGDLTAHHVISADVDASMAINAKDILELKKIILGLPTNTELSVEPWAFVVDDVNMSEEELLFESTSPEVHVNFNSLPDQLNIQATKRGDIDGDIMNLLETRAYTSLIVESEVDQFIKDKKYTVQLYINDSHDIVASQYAFNLDALNVKSIEADGYDYVMDGKTLKVIYFGKDDHDRLMDIRPLSITFTPDSDIDLTTAFQLKEKTANHAFRYGGTKHRLSVDYLRKRGALDNSPDMFLQAVIVPNPVSDKARVYLESLPSEMEGIQAVSLQVYDLMGRIVWHRTWTGTNVKEIFPAVIDQDLTQGLYTWRLTVGDQSVVNTFVKK